MGSDAFGSATRAVVREAEKEIRGILDACPGVAFDVSYEDCVDLEAGMVLRRVCFTPRLGDVALPRQNGLG